MTQPLQPHHKLLIQNLILLFLNVKLA